MSCPHDIVNPGTVTNGTKDITLFFAMSTTDCRNEELFVLRMLFM